MIASFSEAGYVRLPALLSRSECQEIRALYDRPALFRSRVEMRRFRFGQGEYQYFGYPLPEPIAGLRRELYERLAPVANQWGCGEYPPRHEEFLRICADAGQLRPTPLLLRYREGDYNCLHRDLYGEVFFPFQVVIALSAPGEEYTGGELVLVEQRPRAQSVARVLAMAQGDAVAIPTRHRPVRNSRGGVYRANVRHGVSAIHSGERFTLGILFHDAE
jgi:hypothetical protein